jgi:hypothetical protein
VSGEVPAYRGVEGSNEDKYYDIMLVFPVADGSVIVRGKGRLFYKFHMDCTGF